jgi:hypothetical protein
MEPPLATTTNATPRLHHPKTQQNRPQKTFYGITIVNGDFVATK